MSELFMEPTWQSDDGRVRLYLADARTVHPTLPDASVDMICTDPPYGHNNNNGDLIHRWLGRSRTMGPRRMSC